MSLTEKCNLRCTYCMPEEGHAEPEGVLSTSEILTLAELFIQRRGVTKIRLTGGEPTVRKDFPLILKGLGDLSAAADVELCMTTNGVLVPRYIDALHAANVAAINVSLDTFVPAKFELMARRPAAYLNKTLQALELLGTSPSIRTKVNVVVVRGVNDDEVGEFAKLAYHSNFAVRFIEFMPFGGNSWTGDRMVPLKEIVRNCETALTAELGRPVTLDRAPRSSAADTAVTYRCDGMQGSVGVIASMTHAFCGGCNRMRLSADGKLFNCLFREGGTDLASALRAGADEDEILELIGGEIVQKHARLGGKNSADELNAVASRPMISFGG